MSSVRAEPQAFPSNDIRTLQRVFAESRTFAIVGLSADWWRPSYFAAKYLQEQGFRIIPVNPKYPMILGERCYPDLESIPDAIDVVDVFRKPQDCPAVARAAIARRARVLWLQLGVRSPEAEALAHQAGLTVIADRCVKIEYARLFGGLNWFGVNTGVISAHRSHTVPR